jgi:hypothetical protein
MNTSPIDSYDGADAYFTFGPGSAGMWIFLILAFALFLYVGVRAMQFERQGFHEVREDRPEV